MLFLCVGYLCVCIFVESVNSTVIIYGQYLFGVITNF